MLQIRDLNKSFSDRVLFKDCSLFVNEGERIALIGANGSGKTTLFRIIIGDEQCDSGEITLKKSTGVGFLPQEIDAIRGSTLLTEVMHRSSELGILQKEIDELEVKLSETEGAYQKQLLKNYGQVQSKFEQLGGYDLEYQAKKVLAGLGFKEKDFSRATDEFSGGWLMRIALAKLLLNPPELMILDEPTNHLDLESLVWLQNYLHSYKGTLIFTSHDRNFINRITTRIVDIDEGKLVSYYGNYDYYIQEKGKKKELLIAAQKNQERKIKQAQIFIDRFRASNTRGRSVQSRIKALNKMERIEIPKEGKKIRFQFPQPSHSGYEVMSLKDIHKSYGDNKVYEGVALNICSGDKVALVGANGAGKSTLLKILAGVLEIDKGSRITGHNVNLGYYPQHRLDMLNPNSTCLAEIEEICYGKQQTYVRKLLGRFLFSGDDVYKKVSILSGGEKSRLVLVKILANPPNFLLMDEPINHLDIPSRDILIEALSEFTGTLCFISHDGYFIRKVANKVIEIKNGMLKIYPGGYDYYVYKRDMDEKGNSHVTSPDASGKRETLPMESTTKSHYKRNVHAQRDKKTILRKLSEIEKEHVEVSTKLDDLNKVLSDPATYKEDNFISLTKEYEKLKTRMDNLTIEWEEYAEKMDSDESNSQIDGKAF